MQGNPDRRSKTFHALDLLRGVAACAVMLGHMGSLPFSRYATYLSVDLFLLLSGVVIAHAYTDRLANGLSFGHFMIQRGARLWPLYALGLFLGLGVVAATFLSGGPILMGRQLPLQAAQGLFFVPNPPTATVQLFPLNPPAWTLFMELVVNAVFAAGLFRLRTRTLALLAMATLPALLWAADAHQANAAGLNLGGMTYQMLPAFLRCFFSFLVGVVLFRLWQIRNSEGFRLPALGFVIAYLLVIALTRTATSWSLILDTAVVALAWPPLVYLALNVTPHGAMKKLSHLSGTISYPVYMIHYPIMGFVALMAGGEARVGAGTALATAGFVVVAAYWVERHYDQPTRAFLRKLVDRRSARRDASTRANSSAPIRP